MVIWRYIDKTIGFQSDDKVLTRFGRERVSSIRQVIFVYYLAIIIPFLGVALSHPVGMAAKASAAIFALEVCLRLNHYIEPPPPERSEAVSAKAARKTAAMVVLLSCVQAYFYLATSSNAGTMADGLLPLAFGMAAALTQGSAVTGVVFASRAIFVCLTLPITLGVVVVAFQQASPIALLAISLAVISLYLAEICHKRQLSLFEAQESAAEALACAKEINVELTQARMIAQRRSEYDGLTGIRNRSAFLEEVGEKVSQGSRGTLAIIDLDNFKPINDLYGHPAGDAVLAEIAYRLSACIPADALCGRLGGDEFAIFVEPGGNCEQPLAICNRVIEEIKRPILLNYSSVRLGAAVGAQVFGDDARTVHEALKDADDALYIAKRRGLPTAKFFDASMRRERERRNALEAELNSNEATKNFSLVYQPIFDLQAGKLSSMEALARWYSPEIGHISPKEFVPFIEQLGLIREFTSHLLSNALNSSGYFIAAKCVLSFNLSAAHICCEDAANEIIKIVRKSNFPASLLQFEITETALLVNFDVARNNIERLRGFGCRVVLDDFGAGYASLVYLREIQFDKIKLDGSLVASSHDERGRAMLCGVINMISAMGLETVVEHIETARDRRLAIELGARYGQGFYWGKPYGEVQAREFLKSSIAQGDRTLKARRLRAS